jgi:uncharacterized protein (DUF1697 family)
MSRYAVFLRAVNLGPQRKISGADLRSGFEKLGFENVQTFRTSGNIVFDGERVSRAALTARIERTLTRAAGFEVTIFLRTANEVRRLAAQRPFSTKVLGNSKGTLQVLLLPSKPPARTQREVMALATREDRLAFADCELFWLPSGGTQASRLNISAIEKLVGPMTMRTKGVIEELASKFF